MIFFDNLPTFYKEILLCVNELQARYNSDQYATNFSSTATTKKSKWKKALLQKRIVRPWTFWTHISSPHFYDKFSWPVDCYIGMFVLLSTSWIVFSQPVVHRTGAPNVNFRKIYVRKTIWDLEFSKHFCKISCLPASLRIFEPPKNGIISYF